MDIRLKRVLVDGKDTPLLRLLQFELLHTIKKEILDLVSKNLKENCLFVYSIYSRT